MSQLQLKDGGFLGAVPRGSLPQGSGPSTFPDARDREGRSFAFRVDGFG